MEEQEEIGRPTLEATHPSRVPSSALSYRPLPKFFLDDLTLEVHVGLVIEQPLN